ncbi:MAG: glycerophosphodiester phosphodiesterase family protein [Leucobacter sp.]
MAHPYLTGAARPRVLAHRGLVPRDASGVAENTRAAFAAAVAAGAVYLETDCHATKDGEVVLCHDADLVRLLGDSRRVAAVSHREFAELMSGRGGLLTLEEALEEFPEARFNIDVKTLDAAEATGRIVAGHADRVLLTGFSDEYRLRALRAAVGAGGRPATSPGQRGLAGVLIALATRSRGRIARALSGFDALQIPERHGIVRVLSPRLIDAARDAGVEVHVWTVNDPRRMRELVDRGVSGIITDRADLALGALGPGA